jgi:hypothetical protein
VKALLNEEFFRRFLDAIFVFLDRAGTELGHPAIKTNVRILFKFGFVSRQNLCVPQ